MTTARIDVQRGLASTLIAMVLSATLTGATNDGVADARQRLDQRFNAAVKKLIDESRDKQQREWRRQALLRRDATRQYFFVPPTREAGLGAREETTDRELNRLQQVYGSQLFTLATRSLADGQAARAYQWMHEVLRHAPDHDEAQRIVGTQTGPAADVRRGKRVHAKYGWKAGEYLQVDTPYFRITTNGTEQAARALALKLEQLNATWRQLFFDCWSNAAVLQAAVRGRPIATRSRARHQVVLFRERSQYMAFLRGIEPQAEMTLGYYHAPSRTAFFFGDEAYQATWRHEATHQLFQEARRTRAGVGEAHHFWIVEGIALYMESLQKCQEYVTLGGIEADRLQFARYRVLREGFYVPIDRFVRMGRLDLQQDPRIRQLYSQAAGLTHFLMDFEDGKYRNGLIQYLQRVYAHDADADALADLAGTSFSDLDQQYREFLDINDAALSSLEPTATIRNLSLGETQVTDVGLQSLPQLENLVWLDLKGTHVSDQGTTHLATAEALKQLSLEDTDIGNSTVARLANARQLEELDLSNTDIDDVALKTIATLPKLKALWLTGTRVSDDGIRQLQSLSQLRKLDVSETNVTADGWQRLRDSLPNLVVE